MSGIGGGVTNLREYHHNKVSDDAKLVQVGDVVTVYEENKKRGECSCRESHQR